MGAELSSFESDAAIVLGDSDSGAVALMLDDLDSIISAVVLGDSDSVAASVELDDIDSATVELGDSDSGAGVLELSFEFGISKSLSVLGDVLVPGGGGGGDGVGVVCCCGVCVLLRLPVIACNSGSS